MEISSIAWADTVCAPAYILFRLGHGEFGRAVRGEPFLEWIDGDLIRDARAGPTSNSKRRSTLPAPSFNAIHSSEPVAIGDRYFRTCRAHSSELDVRCRKVRDTYI